MELEMKEKNKWMLIIGELIEDKWINMKLEHPEIIINMTKILLMLYQMLQINIIKIDKYKNRREVYIQIILLLHIIDKYKSNDVCNFSVIFWWINTMIK